MRFASLEARDAKPAPLPIECRYFHTEMARIATPVDYSAPRDRFHLLIFTRGSGKIAGNPFRAGDAWLIPAEAAGFPIEPLEPTEFLRTWVP